MGAFDDNSRASSTGSHLAAEFLRIGDRFPKRLALTFGDISIEYGALSDRVRQLAVSIAQDEFQRGKNHPFAHIEGPIVVSFAGNTAALIEAGLGTALAGAVLAMPDPKWTALQCATIIERLRPDILIPGGDAPAIDAVSALRRLAFLDADDASVGSVPAPDPARCFMIGFTSGTTGTPKPFYRSQRSWVDSIVAAQGPFALTADDRILVPGPVVHGLSYFHVLHGLSFGAHVLCQARFDADKAVDQCLAHSVTVLGSVPTIIAAILGRAEHRDLTLPTVRLVTSAGAKLPDALLTRIQCRFPNADVIEYYGASETSFISYSRPFAGDPPCGVGRPFPGVDVSVRDTHGVSVPNGTTGTLWVRSPMISSGYLWADDGVGLRQRDGWVTVGDQASIDDSGILSLAGREGAMIISGGLNIYPAEVEMVLMRHPAIAECLVLGLPDPRWGERVVAVIQGVEGIDPPSVEALREHCAGALEGHKHPREVFAISDFPHTESGKIATSVVRAAVQAGQLRSLETAA